MKKRSGRNGFIFLCAAPAVILFTVFMVIPTINVFRMSLFKRSAYSTTEDFVGLDNFTRLLKDTNFIRSMQNTILLIVVVTIITFGFALVFAAILTREKIKGQNFFRIIFYIPNILSVVVISAILIIAMVWQAIGYYMVMYMASMASIPQSLYESTSLDGAGRITQFFQITLPLIWTNIRTTLTFFIISTINMAFLFVKAMTSGGPHGASEVALSYMYKQAYTNSSYGFGMAIGALVFVFSFGLSALVNAVTKREPLEF